MTGNTNIAWATMTWNPVTGCKEISPGCAHCYAHEQANRLKRFGQAKYANAFEFTVHPKDLNWPLTVKTPERIFVNSMSDMAYEGMPQEFFNAMMDTMRVAHWHTFMVLTKRPENMVKLLSKYGKQVPQNVWMGVSVESPAYLWRLAILQMMDCKVRFVSFEPLLASVMPVNLTGIHWVIVGGESGSKRRPFNVQWAREIRDKCLVAGIPFFYKQGSAFRPGKDRELDRRTWEELPRRNSANPEAAVQQLPREA